MKKKDRIDDRIYVIQAQLGDDDAFMKLVDHYRRACFYYIRRLLEDTDRSDDVLQEVWLTAYKKINTLGQHRRLLSGSIVLQGTGPFDC